MFKLESHQGSFSTGVFVESRRAMIALGIRLFTSRELRPVTLAVGKLQQLVRDTEAERSFLSVPETH